MAANTIILDGDEVLFDTVFGLATVVVKPGTIKASGKSTVQGKKVAVKGDELEVEVSGCQYFSTTFPLPGYGTLKIAALGPDQLTKKTKSGNKPILLQGSVFIAKFEVDKASPAKVIPPSGTTVLDKTPFYMGTGKIVPSKDKVTGT